MIARSYRTLVHPVLAVDYIANSEEFDADAVRVTANLAKVLAKPKDLAPYIKRHSRFAERIAAWSEEARAHEMIGLSVDILQASWTEKQHLDLLHDWLIGDDSDHASFAVARLRSDDRARFRGEWGRDVAQTIARLAAKRGSFEAMELSNLYELDKAAEPVIEQLAKFVATRLQSRGNLLNEVPFVANRSQGRFLPMLHALEVLGRFPDKVRWMQPAIAVAISKEANNKDATYRNALTNLLKAIE